MRAILTFHSIDASGSVLSFDARLFNALLADLAKKDIPIYDLDTLLANTTSRGVSLTFDDGIKSVYQNALPVLREYQVPAHLFLTTGFIEGDRNGSRQPASIPSFEMLNWKEVEALHQAGIRIENHTHSHPDLRLLDEEKVADECARADEIIQSRLGRKPRYFAYPYGYHSRAARDYVRGHYAGSVTTDLRKLNADEDTMQLPRLDTYYLRSRSHIRLLDSPAMDLYLSLRRKLRVLRKRNQAGA